MIVIGHRGARGLAPENTLAGLQKALQHDVYGLEIDVRVTKDGIVVLHHNRELRDTSGNKLLITARTYAVLRAHKPDLTTLAEVIQSIGGQTKLVIEVKPGEKVAPIIAILKQQLSHGSKQINFLLGSKSQKTLRALHRELPEIQTIVIESWSGVRARWRARQLGTKLVVMRSWWLWPGFIAAMRRSGYQLMAYTMNDPAKVKKWEHYGLYGVITDYPDRFEQ